MDEKAELKTPETPAHDDDNDLQYKKYTGRGPEATHKSEIISGSEVNATTEADEVFRQSVLKHATAKLDKKITGKQNALDATKWDQRTSDLLMYGAGGRDHTDVAQDEAYRMQESKIYCDILEKSRSKLMDRLQEVYGEQDQLERGQDKIRYNLEDLVEELQKETVTLDRNREKAQDGKFHFFIERRIRSGEERVAELEQKQQELMEAWSALQLDMEKVKQKKAGLDLQLLEVDNQLAEFRNLSVTSTQLEEEVSSLGREKEAVTDEILNARVAKVASRDYQKDMNGIVVGGSIYVGGEQVNGEYDGETIDRDVEKNYERESMDLAIEEEKLVRQLKTRQIFYSLNSENIMEYMTYDENMAEFDLLPEEEKKDPSVLLEQLRANLSRVDQDLSQAGLELNLAGDVELLAGAKEMNIKELGLKAGNLAKKYSAIYQDPDKVNRKYDEMMAGGPLIMDAIIQGVVGLWDWVSAKAVSGGGGFLGVTSGIKAADADRTGTELASENLAYGAIYTMLQGSAAMCTLTNLLGKLPGMDIENLISKASLVNKDWSLLGMKVFDASAMTAFSAMGSLISVGKGTISAYNAGKDKDSMREGASKMHAKGLSRFGHMEENAATEKAVEQFSSGLEAACAAASLAMAATGLGGLVSFVPTAVSFLGGLGYGIFKRSKQGEELMNTPEILGGLDYNKDLIDDDHFNEILQYTTGIKDRDSLYQVIKVTDSIDLHRAMRASAIQKNKLVDTAMSDIGFKDREKYRMIKLADIQKRTGAAEDWRPTLLRSVTNEKLDYDTFTSRVAKGFMGADYYDKDRRTNRTGMEKRRNRENRESWWRRTKQSARRYITKNF